MPFSKHVLMFEEGEEDLPGKSSLMHLCEYSKIDVYLIGLRGTYNNCRSCFKAHLFRVIMFIVTLRITYPVTLEFKCHSLDNRKGFFLLYEFYHYICQLSVAYIIISSRN